MALLRKNVCVCVCVRVCACFFVGGSSATSSTQGVGLRVEGCELEVQDRVRGTAFELHMPPLDKLSTACVPRLVSSSRPRFLAKLPAAARRGL